MPCEDEVVISERAMKEVRAVSYPRRAYLSSSVKSLERRAVHVASHWQDAFNMKNTDGQLLGAVTPEIRV
jgi:hypothetical protein